MIEPDQRASWLLEPPFRPVAGKMWSAPLPPDLHDATDRDGDGSRSRLLLFEDRRPLGPAHALHDLIEQQGSGRFSFWKTVVYFSSSDNSDPNINGRSYIVGLMPDGAARLLHDQDFAVPPAGPAVGGYTEGEAGSRAQLLREDGPDAIHDYGHRDSVGGLWKEIGRLQYAFLLDQGLHTSDVVIDVACGSLRGGIHLIRYLEPRGYLGIDKRIELIIYGVASELGTDLYREKRPRFVISDKFEFEKFDRCPDLGIGQSIFSHLDGHDIVLCLRKLGVWVPPDFRFYANFREIAAPRENPPKSQAHAVFDYTRDQMARFAKIAGWSFEYIGDWRHPRDLKMALYQPQR